MSNALWALWPASLVACLACCQQLGSFHAYGKHSQLQVAAAIACSLILATWALAEAGGYFRRHRGHSYELATTEDPDPVIFGAKIANSELESQAGHSTNVCEATKAEELSPSLSERAQAWLCQNIAAWRAGAELCVLLGLLYVCDRTSLLPDGPKMRDPRQFWTLWALIVVAACFTARKGDDKAPLSRDQTDEWKGWMQIMFLMYHYFEEKEVYNAIRVYIAAYVWMTGYGNFHLYRKGKSFTLRRTAQMMFRLNFLGFVACVVLRNEYMLYYICAMHTLFTVFVLAAMFIGHTLNSSYSVLWVKIGATLAVTALLYDGPEFIFRWVFGTLPGVRPLFAFHDPLHPEFTDEMHEFHFRSGLDRFIWIIGMICALHFQYFTAFLERLASLPTLKRISMQAMVFLLALVLGWLWWKNVFQLEKLTYNKVHPYTSFIPLFIYLLFRNFTEGLRQRHLHLFACMGRYTLETYILQFHIWMKTTGLNGSPKRLLVVIPGYYWLNFAVLTVAYVFVSVRFSNLTGVLRDALIPDNLLSMCKIWTILIALGGTCWLSSLLWMGSLADVGWP
ncbi:unnamed protein product [Effrenium voratum]|uniref:Cas1p 10 TM acyl transferase domain-containing protein n=1 Tax=Effrenium voratum TaxID=2562239 RepID=A0AA36IPG6_9DINO|nr:unnamed protein product [Effrenium voratum]